MRILTGIDIPFDAFGGSPIICDDWYSNLPKRYSYLFVTMPPKVPGKWWHMPNVRMLKTQKVREQKHYTQYIQDLVKEVSEIVNDFKPDVIHLQHLNYGLSRAFVEAAPHVPKIGICHGTDTQIATSSKFFLQNLVTISDAADVLVFPAQQMADDFFKVYGKQKHYKVIQHGLPTYVFAKHSVHPSGKPLKLLYAGRLNSYKGADIAVDAVGRTKAEVLLDIYGKEDEAGYSALLDSLIKKHNLKHRVTMHDQVTREQLLNMFANYDAILIPSRKLEAFSLTAVEAQARGLPVIYGNGGGIISVIGDAGIQITDNSPATLASIFEAIEHDHSILEDYRARGYGNAKHYTLKSQIDSLIELSRQLCQEPHYGGQG